MMRVSYMKEPQEEGGISQTSGKQGPEPQQRAEVEAGEEPEPGSKQDVLGEVEELGDGFNRKGRFQPVNRHHISTVSKLKAE